MSVNTNQKISLSLLLTTLGVVYGDIGTSPLYAINEIFFGSNKFILNEENIFGPISLVIWTITIIVSFKYLSLVLRADNDGEGGVFALYGRLHNFRTKYNYYLKIILILASGLLIGEGIITPPISVLSAVEGLAVYNSNFNSQIIPITLLILTLLFLIQSKGTQTIGKAYGVIALVWFAAISYFGITNIIATPQILKSLNPIYGILFLNRIQSHQIFILLGSVMLVVTGGEALFADMGHFGKSPIKKSWFLVVFPALILNYLGQGAFLLSGKTLINNNIFYSMISKDLIFPTVILATLATVIASQALISGAFSLTSQAVALGLFPRVKIKHTHEDHAGQIYVPLINWILFFGTSILVLIFKSSTSLAAAYGLSVSGVMLSTTLSMMAISRLAWKWSPIKIISIFAPLFIIDLTFLISNSFKFLEGGFIPLTIGVFIFFIMRIWKWGRKATFKAYENEESMTMRELLKLKFDSKHFIEKNVLLLVPKPLRSLDDKAPALLQLFYNRYGILPKNIFLVEAVHRKSPYIHGPRYESYVFCKDDEKGSINSTTIHFGFMEDANIESVLEDLATSHKLDISTDPHKWLVHTVNERLIPSKNLNFINHIKLKIFIFLRQVTMPAYVYYGLGRDVNLTIDIMPIEIKNK